MKTVNINFKKHKKLLTIVGLIVFAALIFSGFKWLFEFIFFLCFIAVIYHMFFSKKEVKQYDPREHDAPGYDKTNYITPVENQEESYTSAPPVAQSKPFANEPAIKQEISFDSNPDITVLGYGLDNQEPFTLSDKEANGMIALAGATGVGKTETIKRILDKPIKNNHPIIIVDGKGSPSFFNDMKEFCDKNHRNFKLFHLFNEQQAKEMVDKLSGEGKHISIPESYHYNSLRHGGFTELKDKVISLFDWSEEHYKLQAERYLQGVFKLLSLPETKEITGINITDLKVLSKFLNYNWLQSYLNEHAGEEANFMRVIMSEVEESAAKGLANRINSICESELSHLFIDTQAPNVIDIMQSIENNDVIFFSLDSLKFAEYAKMLGRLIIADLKTVSPHFFGSGKKIWCVFDEFNVFASEIVVNLINKTREYGFRNVVSFQELADLVINGDRKLLSQILGNTNVKIIMRQDVHSSAEEIANSVNTKDINKVTISYGTESDEITPKGGKKNTSITQEEEFIYKPREVLQLKIGEAICFTKFPDFKYNKIKIKMVK